MSIPTFGSAALCVVIALTAARAFAAPPAEPAMPPSLLHPAASSAQPVGSVAPTEQPASAASAANTEQPKSVEPAPMKPEERLAAYTEWLTVWTSVLALSTLGLLAATFLAGRDTRRMASAAENGNKLTRDMLVATNRPWISVRVELESPLKFSPPNGWQITVAYTLSNVGHSPAASTDVVANMIPFVMTTWPVDSLNGRNVADMPTLGTTTREELDKLCTQVMEMSRARAGFGRTIFPGDELKGTHTIHGHPPLFEKAMELEPAYSGQFHLIFCVGYGSTFDDTPHVTAKAFTIFKRNVRGVDENPKIRLDGQTLLLNQLEFAPVPDSKTDIAT